MARDGLFKEFVDAVGGVARDALDIAGEKFGDAADRIEDGVSRVGERVVAGAEALQGRVEGITDRIGSAVSDDSRLRDGAAAVRDAIGDAIDPVRDVGRTALNVVGAVTEVATLGLVEIEASEGEGLSLELGTERRNVDLGLDLDATDGDRGVALGIDTVRAGAAIGVDRIIDTDSGRATTQIGLEGELGSLAGEVGIAATGGRTAAGQRGFDLAAFTEALDDEGEVQRRDVGLAVNVDASDGQVGLDVGGVVQVATGDELRRTEAVLTANLDASSGQVGRDRGVALESFADDVEAERIELAATANVGFSDGQIEIDKGFATERSGAGVESQRTEVGVSFDVGFDDGVIETQQTLFREREEGQIESERSEFVFGGTRVGVDDGAVVRDRTIFGREEFENGEETFSSSQGIGTSFGVNDEGHFEFSLDQSRRVELDGVELIDERDSLFFLSTDLTDPENIRNAFIVMQLAGVDTSVLPPPETVASFFEGDASGAIDFAVGSLTESAGAAAPGSDLALVQLAAEMARKVVAFNTGENREGLAAVLSPEKARELAAELAALSVDDDSFGAGAIVPTSADSGASGTDASLVEASVDGPNGPGREPGSVGPADVDVSLDTDRDGVVDEFDIDDDGDGLLDRFE